VVAADSASFEDVVQSLQGSGITAAQLSGIGNPLTLVTTGLPGVAAPLQWVFTVPEPLAKFKETAAMLAALQQTVAQKGNGFNLSFSVSGAQASPKLLTARQCPVTDLLADARTQAQKLSGAAGLTLGPILALSSANSTGVLASSIAVISPTPAQRNGDFSFLLPGDTTPFPGNIIPISRISSGDIFASFLLGTIYTALPPVQPLTCYLTVKFGATRY
jgi:hypothetical protein